MFWFAAVLGTAYAETPIDECALVCEAFESERLGDGFDLCEIGGTSHCFEESQAGIHLCSNLYWSVDVDGARGLIYETNATALPLSELSNPLTCAQALDIARDSVSNLNMALQMFVHSAPIRNRLAASAANEARLHGIWYALARFQDGDRTLAFDIAPQFSGDELRHVARLFAAISTERSFLSLGRDIVDSFIVRLTRQECELCMQSLDYMGVLPVSYSGTNGEPIDLVEALRRYLVGPLRANCPLCFHSEPGNAGYTLNSTSNILSICITQSAGNISIPLILNLTEIVGDDTSLPNQVYRLYGFAADNHAATIRVEDAWYLSDFGAVLNRIAPITEPVVSDSVNLVLYERV